MKKPLRVLMVGSSEDDARALLRELRQGGYDTVFERVETPAGMRAALERSAWDVVISDYILPQFSGPSALAVLRETGLDLPFLIVSGTIGEERAVEALKNGAHDFIVKGHWNRLLLAVEREMRAAQERHARRRAEEGLRRHAARTEALVHVAACLNAQLDLDRVLNTVCEETARALGAPAAAVALFDPQRDLISHAAGFGLPPEYRERHLPVSRDDYDRLARRADNLLVIPDTSALPPETPNAELLTALRIRTAAAASLKRAGQLIGDLSVFAFGDIRSFTSDELSLLRGLADQAAQAISNARLFEETGRRLGRLQALRHIDLAITASTDLRVTLSVVLEELTRQLQVDAAAVLLLNRETHTLEHAAGRGFRTAALQHTRLPVGEGNAGRAALERRLVSIPDLRAAGDAFARAPLLANEGFVAYYAVPLIVKGHVIGVLETFHRAPLHPDPEWLSFLESLAGQAAIAIENATLFEELQRSNAQLALSYDSTLEGWTRALDLRDHETEGHTQRVTELTLQLAQATGNFSEADLLQMRRGALLHDIGKMGIPDQILLKPGPLTPEEWVVMRRHPEFAHDMLVPIPYLRPALDIPYCHHERWDGTGYPRRLRGEEIPLAARLFAPVDVWDALCSDRPYRAAWPKDKVRDYISSRAGVHFDPAIVEAFLGLVN
jgi:response regulator RpfG family c-di-GMP phosphodiesterase/putative methionine-R-sulfoxide reductase with GAF domain